MNSQYEEATSSFWRLIWQAVFEVCKNGEEKVSIFQITRYDSYLLGRYIKFRDAGLIPDDSVKEIEEKITLSFRALNQ